jgi:hypothetical protein
MRSLRKRTLVTAATLAALAFVHLSGPRPAAADIKQIWGMSNLGDTCTGSCGSTNICCRIVIIVG